MNILVVGSGGREHAIALAVKKSPMCDTLVCAPGNPGMANLGKCVPVDVADPKAIADLAVAERIDLAVIGPEIPLVAGVVDEFRARGLRAFGPTAAAAALEGSKAFSKDIMKKYNVPTREEVPCRTPGSDRGEGVGPRCGQGRYRLHDR